MPESVKQCVTSTMEEENVSESDAYAICWAKFNEGELKEDEDYEWGPYSEEEEEPEDVEAPVKEKIHRTARKIYEEHDSLDKEGAYAVSFATIAAEEAGFKDVLGVKTVAYKTVTGEWPGIHASETLNKGREHLIKTYKYVVDKILGQGEVAKTLSKSDTMEKINFTADFAGTQTVFKSDDDFIIWGPASVEVVDKEGDRIHAEALEDALPQLLKRGRLSLEHSDQLVGKIIESFELEENVKLEIDGETYERKEFPTDVLEHNGKPALFVCGKIYDDTRQSRRVRESIENGELNSYSISGEALVSRSKIENGEPVNDIVELDLSAVTVCEEGMNQAAKFATVKSQEKQESDRNILTVKSDSSEVVISKSDDADAEDKVEHSGNRTVKISNNKTMSEETEKSEDSPTEITLDELTDEFQNVVKEALKDESFAKENDVLGKEDVEDLVEDLVQEKMDEMDGDSTEEDVEKSDDESEDLTREDVEGIAKEVAEETASSAAEEALELFKEEMEEEEEEEEEEKGDYEDDKEEMEEEKDVSSGKQSEEDLASAIAEMTGADEDDAMSALEDLSNKEDDEEMEDEEEKADDEEMEDEEEEKGDYEDEEMEDEEEKTGGSQYTVSELKEKLPEDVFDAVRGYIGEEKAEKSKTESTDLSDLDIDAAVEKAIGEKFDTVESPETPEGDVEKSYGEDGEEVEVENPALSLWRNN